MIESNLSIHLAKFNNRIKVMNQTQAKDLILTAADARNLHSEVFTLLAQIAVLTEVKEKERESAIVEVEVSGGGF